MASDLLKICSLNSFGPDGYDMDVNELFEAGLGFLLQGFRAVQ
jgi:hypothetical protein